MANSMCQACGTETRWVTIDGERVALNRTPSVNGRYVLDPENIELATKVQSPGLDKLGYDRHDETCPMKLRDRERRERVL